MGIKCCWRRGKIDVVGSAYMVVEGTNICIVIVFELR